MLSFFFELDMFNALKWHFRYTDAVYSKVQPTIANVQDMVSRTVATVTPEFVRNYQTRGLIEGLEEEDEDLYR